MVDATDPQIHEFTDLERQSIRSVLAAELARTQEQAASPACQFDDIVAAAEMSNTDDGHDPEGTTIAFERSQVSALHSQALDDVAALHRTLVDLDDAGFGACDERGGQIGFERLVARPATRRCVSCVRQRCHRPPGRGRSRSALEQHFGGRRCA